jgi:hypothetical protein
MNLKRCGLMGSAIVMIALLVVAGGCSGKKQEAASPAGGTETSAAAAAETAKPEPVAGGAEITKTDTAIIIKGSGSGDVGPVEFDQPCYIVKAKYQSATEYSTLNVIWMNKFEGNEIERPVVFLMAGHSEGVTNLFTVDKMGQPSKSFTFKVTSEGSYTIEFQKLPALATALAAPQTFKGGPGTFVSPLIKNTSNYVMLEIKYTGPVEGNAGQGIPLVTGDLYDAETGDPVVRNQSCFAGNRESSDGHSAEKPGVYFAIINCSQANGAWEVTIKQ